MKTPVLSTIAQILFESTSTLNYARIVAELEQVLARLKPDQLKTTWDCDDLVFFDLAETRIGLGIAEFAGTSVASCLTVSVGPCPGAADQPADAGYDVLCSRIVERLQSRYLPVAVLWNQTEAEITPDLIDALTDALPAVGQGLPPVQGLIDPVWQAADTADATWAGMHRVRKPAEAEVAPQPADMPMPQRQPASVIRLPMPQPNLGRMALAANDMPAAAAPHAQEMLRLRGALYPETPDFAPVPPMSTQMRLAVHAMNATLIMVWMPLGAAVMTYSILKGEDMRVSGRIMALTGTVLAFAHVLMTHAVTAAVAGT